MKCPRDLLLRRKFACVSLGNRKLDNARLAGKLKLLSGQNFDQNQQNLDLKKLRDEYGGEGYVFAKIEVDNRFLEEPGKLDIVYNVDEGDRYRIERIKIEASGDNPHAPITAVLNRLSVKPGDIADTREIRASERRLKASQSDKRAPMENVLPKIVCTPADSDSSLIANRGPTTFYHYGDGRLPPLPRGERYLDLDIYLGLKPTATNNSAESKVPAESPRPVLTGVNVNSDAGLVGGVTIDSHATDAKSRPPPGGATPPPRATNGGIFSDENYRPAPPDMIRVEAWIQVEVWQFPGRKTILDGVYTVGDDGTIHLRDYGTLHVAGLTEREAEKRIVEAVSHSAKGEYTARVRVCIFNLHIASVPAN